MANFQIPSELEKRLYISDNNISDNNIADNLKSDISKFADLLSGDKLEFFIEYTDHSIEHINKVLNNIENLMTKDTLEKLNYLDVTVIIVAVVLHDIGMKATVELFQNLLNGSYDYGQPGMPNDKNIYNDKPWKELWEDYVKESQFWNAKKKINVIGDSEYLINREEINKKIFSDELNKKDNRFIGEFIRLHHGRIAYEVAIRGVLGYNNHSISLRDHIDDDTLQLAGIVARSHSMGLRDNYKYLIKITDETNYKSPFGIDVILHMVLIRLSDYLHIDKDRTNETILYLRKTWSPYSLNEHRKHLSIRPLKFNKNDESISVSVKTPIETAELFVSIERLIRDIQTEFDTCWAALGEQYSDRGYKLNYRRITSDIFQDGELSIRNTQKFVPKQFGFKFNNSLFGLLIAPLYGKNPSYGVRELVQNAVDACRVRMIQDKDYSTKKDFTHVTVSLDPETKLFTIVDTGIGMNIEEIEKYFLTIGSSYESSIDWKIIKDEINRDLNKIYRTGRFGIGILAAFLLGPTITVKTKRYKSKYGYQFSLRLDKDFIQIDKIDSLEYGTTIDIVCNDNAFELLKQDVYNTEDFCLGTDKWFGWYVDSKPRVDYFYHGIPIQLSSSLIDGYRHLSSSSEKSRGFGDISWKPFINTQNTDFLLDTSTQSKLYCNGFLITTNSLKSKFSFSGFENYFPYEFRIPDLMLKDIHNQLRINLQRDNIDENERYPFEEDLAIDLCKNYLCTLLSINIRSFKYIRYFLFHKYGFIYNKYNKFPYELKDGANYFEKCLCGNLLVHVFFGRDDRQYRFNYHSWEPFIAKHPEAFFAFSGDDHGDFHRSEDILKYLIGYSRKFHNSPIVVHNDSLSVYKSNVLNISDVELIGRIDNHYSDHYIKLSDCSFYEDIVNDIVSFLEDLHDEETPMAFMVYYMPKREFTTSPVDSIIDKYAGGDTIIPYDENERKQKFAKLYAKKYVKEMEQCQKFLQSLYFKMP